MINKYIKYGITISFAFLLAAFVFYRFFIFNKAFYERISGIPFPEKYDIIETRDNGEFVTITSMYVDSLDLVAMIKTYNFDTLKMAHQPRLSFGENLLQLEKPDNQSVSHQFVLHKSIKKNDCHYLIDLNRKILWAEIGYPDWSGN